MSETDRVPASLTLDHLTLDTAMPARMLALPANREHLLYALIGHFRVYANGFFLGSFGGRRSVTEPLAHVVRFPAGVEVDLVLVVDGPSADCLLAAVGALDNRVTKLPYAHFSDTTFHQVGTGTHQRRVGEVPTPHGYLLSCGETYQEAGMISSWPPHATAGDLEVYAANQSTWQEIFFVIAPQPATVTLIGLYPGGRQVSEVRPVTNGEIVLMPLGSHAIQAHPASFLFYVWIYCGSALRKSYNATALDTGTYRT